MRKHVLAVDPQSHAIEGVDRETGDRVLVSSNTVGSGPNLLGGRDLAISPQADRVLFPGTPLTEVTLRSGERRRVAGEVPDMSHLTWVSDGSSERVAFQRDNAAIWILTLDGGAATLVSDATRGTGTPFTYLVDLAYDSQLDATHLFALDWNPSTLGASFVRVDLATGDRTVVSDATTGTGPALLQPFSIALDAANRRAFVGDANDGNPQLIEIDVTSGARTVLGAIEQMAIREQLNLAYDRSASRVILAGERGVWAFDLATRALTRVSGDGKGSGPPIRLEFYAVALWGERSVALAPADGQLVAFDLVSGDWVISSR